MGKTIILGKSGLAIQAGTIGSVFTIKGGTAGSDTFFGTGGDDTYDAGGGSDTIYGAGGNDVLRTGGGSTSSFDTAYGGDGSDTLYGGSDVDMLFGGAGNDSLFNEGGHSNGEVFDGGAGNDILRLQLSNLAAPIVIRGGPDDASDGNDFIQVSGRYEIVQADLGNGHDKFIGGLDPEQAQDGSNSDLVSGGAGNDEISAWFGKDVLSGETGDDVMWGGAGDDTLFGGSGIDFLYGGTDVDTLVGGAQTDYYYWSREDGQGDQIYDELRLGDRQTDINGLLIFGVFEPSDGTLKPGTGVFESDHDIMDKDGMVRVTNVDDGEGQADIWRLEILTGEGAGNYVEFDPRDVPVIGLSNHDMPVGQGLQIYVWNERFDTYEYQSGASLEDFEKVRIM